MTILFLFLFLQKKKQKWLPYREISLREMLSKYFTR